MNSGCPPRVCYSAKQTVPARERLLEAVRDLEGKVDDGSRNERHHKRSRAVPVVVIDGATRSDRQSTIQEHRARICDGNERKDGEGHGGRKADVIVLAGEVQETDSDGRDENRELDPGLKEVPCM